MKNVVETIINLFTVHDGKISILLLHKKEEPYKGYWVLPSAFVKEDETLDENTKQLLSLYFNNYQTILTQNAVFGELERYPDKRVIGISYVGFVDSMTIELQELVDSKELGWFDITTLPKLGYDHAEVIGEAVNFLRTKFKEISTLKELYPSDFTLPELQHMYEIVFNKHVDRRNFRKKLMHLGCIEETGDIEKGSVGRPAKLYRFCDDFEQEELF